MSGIETRAWYSIVSWGIGPSGVYRSMEEVYRALERWRNGRYSGMETTIRIYRCRTRALARSADISEVRDGEEVL